MKSIEDSVCTSIKYISDQTYIEYAFVVVESVYSSISLWANENPTTINELELFSISVNTPSIQ